jgi:hypothetical protein
MSQPILKERPLTFREAYIPYAMAGINILAPTLAARDIIFPQVYLAAMALILLGLPCSIYFRLRQYNYILLNLITLVPLLAFTYALVHTHPGVEFDWGNPIDSLYAQPLSIRLVGLLHIAVMLAAGRAFLLVTTKELVQTPIPGIAIYLLAVISEPGREAVRSGFMPLLLLLIVASSLYLFSIEHHQQWFSIHPPARIQRKLLLWALGLTVLLAPLTYYAGWHLPFNAEIIGERYRNRSYPGWRGSNFMRRGVEIGFSDRIDMGGSNWPSGKQPVMTVKLRGQPSFPPLWRGGTYTNYHDGGWHADEALMPPAQPSGDPPPGTINAGPGWKVSSDRTTSQMQVTIDPAGPVSDPGLRETVREGALKLDDPTVQLEQEFSMIAEMRGRFVPVYGAYPVISISSHDPAFFRAVAVPDGNVFLRNIYRHDSPRTYRAVSLVKPLPTVLKLKADPPVPDRHRYLQMPGGNRYVAGTGDGDYAHQVRALALDILAERNLTIKSAPLDIVRQFSLYLGQHYRYTLKPSPPPPGEDPIIDFLTTQKQGYCNYFSGAMVMLCRSVGIPARFVVGFASGETMDNEPEAGVTEYRVTVADAHSWVEVYLPNYGWYTMDPTAGSQEVPTLWGATWDGLTHFWTGIKTTVRQWYAAFLANRRVRLISITFIALLLGTAGALLYLFRDRPPSYPKELLAHDEAHRTIIMAYRRMHRWLKKWGVVKPRHLTATEFDALFIQVNPPMGEVVSELSQLYRRTLYGPDVPGDTEARQAIALLHRLWEIARNERKRLYAEAPEPEA